MHDQAGQCPRESRCHRRGPPGGGAEPAAHSRGGHRVVGNRPAASMPAASNGNAVSLTAVSTWARNAERVVWMTWSLASNACRRSRAGPPRRGRAGKGPARPGIRLCSGDSPSPCGPEGHRSRSRPERVLLDYRGRRPALCGVRAEEARVAVLIRGRGDLHGTTPHCRVERIRGPFSVPADSRHVVADAGLHVARRAGAACAQGLFPGHAQQCLLLLSRELAALPRDRRPREGCRR